MRVASHTRATFGGRFPAAGERQCNGKKLIGRENLIWRLESRRERESEGERESKREKEIRKKDRKPVACCRWCEDRSLGFETTRERERGGEVCSFLHLNFLAFALLLSLSLAPRFRECVLRDF